ncbi:diacylglycerol kinase family protein [Metabacillus iocasae]|uniref:Undecaprenol kinase n=1 Tax=Priestia iocasae TaxID=2291674 RepID=A0ABS2QPV8_9BACI|nr:diacylglycerol kinase family protein [Metabacillus iocasae]MBM7701484.1 undecaprenol kinase [Metabacillus iocasae]
MKLDGKRLWRSFGYAWQGIQQVIKTEQNMQVHVFAALLVIGAGLYFRITVFEWMILIVLIAGMWSLELINTAIEKTIDLVTEEYHPLAKKAKDAAAGAVLVYAIASVIVGGLVFFKYIF